MESLSDVIALRKKRTVSHILANTTASFPATSILTTDTAAITTGFQYQAKSRISYLNQRRDTARSQLMTRLTENQSYERGRRIAVDLAWEYEKTDVEWGGKGSEKWTRAEREEILRRGRIQQEKVEGKIVKEYPGHHRQNVHNHPEEQTNPDNIKFYRSREDHIREGHNGDSHNESDQPMIDRTKMLKRTNMRRVLKNEVFGAGITAIIAFASSISIAFIVDCAKNGWSPEARKNALRSSVKAGFEATLVALTCYGISRIIMVPAQNAIIKFIDKVFEYEVGEEGRILIGGSIFAVVTLVITSIYTFYKLRKAGYEKKDAWAAVAKQAVLSVLITSIILSIQYSYGNIWAIVAGVVITIGQVGYTIFINAKEKALLERIQHLIIEKSYPSLAIV